MHSNWKSPPGSPWELIVPAALLLVTFGLPFTGVVDCYPFSGAPMFNETPRTYCEYTAFDGKGSELPLDLLGLQRNDNGNPPGHGHGRKPKFSIDRLGKVSTAGQIEAAVLQSLKLNQFEVHGFVTVKVRVIKDLDRNQIGEDPNLSWIQVVKLP